MTAEKELEMKDALEKMVDGSNLSTVVKLLSQMCLEKADHIRTNWQDEETAKSWEEDASILEKTYKKIAW